MNLSVISNDEFNIPAGKNGQIFNKGCKFPNGIYTSYHIDYKVEEPVVSTKSTLVSLFILQKYWLLVISCEVYLDIIFSLKT